jgi:HK97 family phage major capsid protein
MAIQAQIQAAYNEATELYGQMKTIIDEYAGKAWPAEKEQEFDRLSDAHDKKVAEAERLKKAAARGDALDQLNSPQGRLGAGGNDEGKDQKPDDPRMQAIRAAFRGEKGNAQVRFSTKDLGVSTDAGGGFLVGPTQMVNDFIKFVDDEVFIRQLATKYRLVNGETLGAVALDADLEDADWTSEVQTGQISTVNPFGKRELKPSPLAKQVKISKKLIRQAVMDVEQLVMKRLAYKFGITQEKAYMTGDGASKPLGVFVASPMGISTARDVVAASATVITADEVLDTKHNLKAAYWNRPSTRWMLSRTTLRTIRKLKDTTNNYLWAPGLGPGGGMTGGIPATLVDTPYLVSEYAPGTFTAGLYVAIIGDFSQYWIADALDFEVQVLTELYATTNQNGYVARLESDGQPVLEEAFSRLRMA